MSTFAEQHYTCPHCWRTNVIQLDLSAGSQSFVQDCEVCCNPIEFQYSISGGEVVNFHYESAQE